MIEGAILFKLVVIVIVAVVASWSWAVFGR